MTGFYDGEILCMWGVLEESPMLAVPWLLGSKLMDDKKIAKGFLKISKFYYDWVTNNYEYLSNFSDARNTVSHRWLKWLGFHLGAAVPFGQAGEEFIEFSNIKLGDYYV